jgi:hypothetical protein
MKICISFGKCANMLNVRDVKLELAAQIEF